MKEVKRSSWGELRCAAALLSLATGGCTLVHEPLPDVAPSASVAMACNDAMPPAVLPMAVGSELHSCLSPTQLRGETTLVVGVARDGTATSVTPAVTLCLVVAADGKPLPKLDLTAAQQQCLLERLRSWRFAAYETCAPQAAYVEAAQPASECD